MSRQPLVLGVDGGGTKSIGLVADPTGHILTRRESGASNVNVVGLDGAARSLAKVITDCCDDVRCPPDELSCVVLALAGAGDDVSRKRIKDAVNNLFVKEGRRPLSVIIESDARAALEGAFDGSPGVVIIAGTGSVVIGKNNSGELLTVGGWGRILGDEGSGFFVGREAVRVVALQMDRRGEATKLKDMLAETYKWQTRADIIHAVYQEKFELSRLAPIVLEAAAQHDIVSQKLLQTAALQLAEQARVIVMQMGILRKIGLVMVGGLIDHENVYSNTLHMKLLKLLPQVDVRQPIHSPAHGAVLIALEQLKKS
jgi:N-acetylglucosamine kinase-like BadF-type ATPase